LNEENEIKSLNDKNEKLLIDIETFEEENMKHDNNDLNNQINKFQ
jgi:hypothetical protein